MSNIVQYFYAGKKVELIQLPKPINDMIGKLFPKVDWDKVRFCRGLPWFMRFGSGYSGITMPAPDQFQGVDIWLKSFDPAKFKDISILVHECFHVQQYWDLSEGKGSAYFKKFLPYYLGLWFKFGYEKHPYEIAAYAYEKRFKEYFVQSFQHENYEGIWVEKLKFTLNKTWVNALPQDYVVHESGLNQKPRFFYYAYGFFVVGLLTFIGPLLALLFRSKS